MEGMEGKKVMVAGAGKSGIASAGLLLRHGASVTLYDGNAKLDGEKIREKFSSSADLTVRTGDFPEELLKETDLMVISPGISIEAPFVEKTQSAGIPVWGEIELAAWFNQGIMAAITGTNGKTTTTTLVGEIFRKHTPHTLVVGNIGQPFAEFADTTTPDTLVAAEISSFQLESIHKFHPHVSAILNLTPDHLDRHHTFDNYAACKFRIQENQTEEDFCVLNADDPEIRERENLVKKARIIHFSRTTELEEGVFLAKDGWMKVRDQGKETAVLPASDIQILGDHNQENVLAAIAISWYMGIPAEEIWETVKNFKGVEHRIEFTRELNGVRYYNDSKGTNPDAAKRALLSMKGTTCLIGGGYDKKIPFDDWVSCFPGRVRFLVLIGETAEEIARCCKDHGFHEFVMAGSLKDAVRYCYEHAWPGDNVLLSPACASWDMFPNYEERGRLFKQYVAELEEVPQKDGSDKESNHEN